LRKTVAGINRLGFVITLSLAVSSTVLLSRPLSAQSTKAQRPVLVIELVQFNYPDADAVIIRRPGVMDAIARRMGKTGREAIALALHQLMILRAVTGDTVAEELIAKVTGSDGRDLERRKRDESDADLVVGMLKMTDVKEIPGVGRGRVVEVRPIGEAAVIK
jgi:hypothetical protein